ncbi:cytoplasmic dynein 1 heavy chain 1 [Reticulomyxa filosa]|uniref:Cytoplasmic dynein 1 heavy chain 1 n=1 Tax=Reticulomyxa filosa TaxID=46433 RepID=X6M473_RETFI|nr:cytoplasmic dynein 1 heavy chain 1 [Reticulomyxa filosa]|eukprot:ETO08391.1 cytoplasmic dynein 1 heavy chain 1 [Reticulomyxa filosa]
MFLVTKYPSAAFAPDLCSRVTFVNFSEHQVLYKDQKHQIYNEQRNDQLRLQRELEDQLLDDNNIVTTLENLKLKAKVVQEKAEKSEQEEASKFYTPFARACTKLYFSLESLSNVHFLYQYIVNEVLQSDDLEKFKEIFS